MAWESAEGQALELGWQRDNRIDLSDEDYLRMVLQKTCWLARDLSDARGLSDRRARPNAARSVDPLWASSSAPRSRYRMISSTSNLDPHTARRSTATCSRASAR